MPCVYLPGPAPAVTVANNIFMYILYTYIQIDTYPYINMCVYICMNSPAKPS